MKKIILLLLAAFPPLAFAGGMLDGGQGGSSSGAGLPGGSDTQVQYNSSGRFAGSPNMSFDGTSLNVSKGSVTASGLFGDGSHLTGINTSTTSPGGSPGAVQFNNSGVFAGDASNLFWDNTNKRLGIGTLSPGVSLHVLNTNPTGTFAKMENTNAGGVKLGE